MKLWIVTLMMLAGIGLAARPALAQRHTLGTVNAETPEGALLQQIGQADDETKKLALMEQFATQFPKHEGIGWIYEQMQAAYIKANQPDKAIDIGGKLIAMDADDLEAAHQNLKAAEAKKDPDAIIKWSAATSAAARKVVASKQPTDADEVEAWKKSVDYAKQVDTYTEYSLYAAAVGTTDPRKRIELGDALSTRNPKSQYIPQVATVEFAAYSTLGDPVKTLAFAEKSLENDQSSEDILAFVANQYVEKKRDPEKVIAYSAKIVELMDTKPIPAGVSEADWAKKKAAMSGLAHFLSGSTLYGQKKYAAADKELRAALPLVEGSEQLKAATLFYAGLANYDMKNTAEATRFLQQCAAIKSQFQAQANKNLTVMKSQPAAAGKK